MAKKVQYRFDPFEISGESRIGITKSKQNEILKEVSEFILSTTEERLDRSLSSVSGQGKFQRLKTGGASILEESGDMRAAQRIKPSGDSIVHTVLSGEQPKADNHNKFSAKSKRTEVPRRQFIPNKSEGQTYNKTIVAGIRRIIRNSK